MNRRDLLILGSTGIAWPLSARALQKAMPVIGYLGMGAAVPLLLDAFRRGLSELGWVEGESIVIEYRFAEGQYDRLPGLADELVRLRVAVIAAAPTPAVQAAKTATETIPIVGISFDNPVEQGLVASLARPGGNVTGVSYSVGPEIFGKDLELLRDLMPEVRRVAVLSNSAGPNHALMVSNVKTAAALLRVELLLLDARGPDEFDGAFAAMAKEGVGALFVFGDVMFSVHRARLADLALQYGLPTMYTNKSHVEAGGLMCYGPSFSFSGGVPPPTSTRS